MSTTAAQRSKYSQQIRHTKFLQHQEQQINKQATKRQQHTTFISVDGLWQMSPPNHFALLWEVKIILRWVRRKKKIPPPPLVFAAYPWCLSLCHRCRLKTCLGKEKNIVSVWGGGKQSGNWNSATTAEGQKSPERKKNYSVKYRLNEREIKM